MLPDVLSHHLPHRRRGGGLWGAQGRKYCLKTGQNLHLVINLDFTRPCERPRSNGLLAGLGKCRGKNDLRGYLASFVSRDDPAGEQSTLLPSDYSFGFLLIVPNLQGFALRNAQARD